MLKKRIVTMVLTGVLAAFLLAGCGTTETEGTESESSAVSSEAGNSGDTADSGFVILNPEDVAENLESVENPSFTQEDVRGLSVVVDGETRYQINYTEREDRQSFLFWDMVTPYASTAVTDSETMYELFDTLTYLDLNSGSEESVDETLDPGSFETYITLNYYEGEENEEEDEENAAPNRTFTLLIGDEENGSYYCVLKGQEDKAMLLDASILDAVLYQEPYDLLIKVPYLVNYETVAEVHVTYKNKTYTMTKDGDTYTIKGKEVEAEEYTSLYSDLMQPTLDGEIPEDAELADDREPVITIEYIRNLDSALDYEIKIYEYDDDHYTISVNGEENFFLTTEDVETLIEAVKSGF
ncbi:MAG: DUF4340 domain-containing protein [Clostridiales bacterium]|nr:DUF4340 domain-containing protein [Clostridiales bacterium]